ncbi:MAG TPA: hypothetical protein VLM37_08480 [Fibrobacteraceae bacterium]|nr:hypothetical protein [Fibrobacteraceae bacterium]
MKYLVRSPFFMSLGFLFFVFSCARTPRVFQGRENTMERETGNEAVVVLSQSIFVDTLEEEFKYTLDDLFRDKKLNWVMDEEVGLPEPPIGGVDSIPPEMLSRWLDFSKVVFLHSYVTQQRHRIIEGYANESGWNPIGSTVMRNAGAARENGSIMASAYNPRTGKRIYVRMGSLNANNPRWSANLLYYVMNEAMQGLYFKGSSP